MSNYLCNILMKSVRCKEDNMRSERVMLENVMPWLQSERTFNTCSLDMSNGVNIKVQVRTRGQSRG